MSFDFYDKKEAHHVAVSSRAMGLYREVIARELPHLETDAWEYGAASAETLKAIADALDYAWAMDQLPDITETRLRGLTMFLRRCQGEYTVTP